MINHFTYGRKKKSLCPNFANSEVPLCDTKLLFLLLLYILIMVAQSTFWINKIQCSLRNASIACFKTIILSRLMTRRSQYFFLILHTVLSITRLLHEKAHKKCLDGICQWCFFFSHIQFLSQKSTRNNSRTQSKMLLQNFHTHPRRLLFPLKL